ncbi:MAG: hypothetical protein KA712_16495 [Myxococcales bacterium]|nr:hypothetical protein [Myxococcales bacterium]
MRLPARPHRHRESGAVLMVVMLILLGLMGLGMTALWLTSGNLQVGSNVNLRANALYVAEAGIERARELLNGTTPPNLPVLLAGSAHPADSVPTAIDLVTGTANGIGAVLIDRPDPALVPGAPLVNVPYPPASFARTPGTMDAPTATLMGTYTVWIRNDAAELRQGQFTIDGNSAVVVRSRGVAQDGRTSVVLEVSLGPSPAAANVPGAGGPPPPVLCNAGKNACDDNNSTQYGIVVQ